MPGVTRTNCNIYGVAIEFVCSDACSVRNDPVGGHAGDCVGWGASTE